MKFKLNYKHYSDFLNLTNDDTQKERYMMMRGQYNLYSSFNSHESYPAWNSYYNIFPYYGYNDAYKDVIDLLEDAENLPDSTLYALARSYNQICYNLSSKL